MPFYLKSLRMESICVPTLCLSGSTLIEKFLPIPEAGVKERIRLTAAKSKDWKYLKDDCPISQMKMSTVLWFPMIKK